MKYLFIVTIFLGSFTLMAQQHHGHDGPPRHHQRGDRPDLTPDQIAELKAKELTLSLDLNEQQQAKVQKLQLEMVSKAKALMESREEKKELSEAEQFERKSKFLDDQIAFKKGMKSILNTNQYEKWEKIQFHRKKGRKQNRMKRRS